MKCPTVEYTPLPPASPDPRTDALQILKGKRALRACGLVYKAFGDDVVGVRGKATLLARQLLEPAACRFGALPLELGAQPALAIAHVLDVRSAHHLAIARRGDVRHPQIDTQGPSDNDRDRISDGARRQQVERATAIHEVG